jgi:hypothetical protein
MKSRKRPASAANGIFPDTTETVAAGLGAVVWTTSVELQPPPVTLAGEKLQVVFAGNCEQPSATGRLKPVPGVMVTE